MHSCPSTRDPLHADSPARSSSREGERWSVRSLTLVRADHSQMLAETESVGLRDRLAAARDSELPVDRDGLGLDRVARDEELLGDLPEGEVRRQQRKEAKLRRSQARSA